MSQYFDPMESAVLTAPVHFNVLNIAWRRKSLFLLGVVVGLVLGSLYYAQQTPVYRCDAQVLVVKKRPDVLPGLGSEASFAYYEDYLATHQGLIKSPLIVARAVQKPGIAELKCLMGASNPTKQIIDSLLVSRDPSRDVSGPATSNILHLSFRGALVDECGIILNAIIESYKDFLGETYRNVSDDTLEIITKARDVLQKDLVQKEKEYRDFHQQSPLLGKGKDGVSLAQERLVSLESKRSSLFLQRTELQGRLAAMEQALSGSPSRSLLAAILPRLPSNATADSARRGTWEEQLLPLLKQEQALLQDYGPNHPYVQGIRKQIAFTGALLTGNEVRPERNHETHGIHETPGEDRPQSISFDALAVYVQSVKQELRSIEMAEQLLAERSKCELEEAKRLANYEFREEAYRNDIARSQQLYDGIIKRLQEVHIIRDFGGYDARVISPPSAGVKVAPRAVPIMAVASFLGLLAGLSLAYLAEHSDRSFRTPEEIQRHLGVPVVGHIVRMLREEAGLRKSVSGQPMLDPVLAAYHRPGSPEAEGYRGVRTALYFGTRTREYKVVQVTSPRIRDGKTTTVANLGISIAQSGKRTLLIEADFRRPQLHEFFGLSAAVGLATVLAGTEGEWEAELGKAIQQSAISGLSLLPCGPIPPNPAELLTSPRFQQVLGMIRDRYDLMLIDTPPLLAVSDPAVVAPRVEGVLLVLRSTKAGRPSAQRAKQILDALGVNVLGVVVNGVDDQSPEGQYGYMR